MSTQPEFLSATTIMSDHVMNPADQELGTITDLMIDLEAGRVAYAVLSVGDFLGLGGKLVAIPWPMLSVDASRECFVLDVSQELLEEAPGIGDEAWPDYTPSHAWLARIYDHYGADRYW